MTDDPQRPETAHASTQRGGVVIPRWVKVFVLVVLAIALALLAHTVVGGGSHGPAMHRSSASTVPLRAWT